MTITRHPNQLSRCYRRRLRFTRRKYDSWILPPRSPAASNNKHHSSALPILPTPIFTTVLSIPQSRWKILRAKVDTLDSANTPLMLRGVRYPGLFAFCRDDNIHTRCGVIDMGGKKLNYYLGKTVLDCLTLVVEDGWVFDTQENKIGFNVRVWRLPNFHCKEMEDISWCEESSTMTIKIDEKKILRFIAIK